MDKEIEFKVIFRGKEYNFWKDKENGLWYVDRGCTEGFTTLNALANILAEEFEDE